MKFGSDGVFPDSGKDLSKVNEDRALKEKKSSIFYENDFSENRLLLNADRSPFSKRNSDKGNY